MNVLIGIVTYKPDRARLQQCLDAVRGWETYIVDNTEHNVGIAAALRQIMAYAMEHGYDWVLTLDQDSVVLPGLLDAYEAYLASAGSGIGALTCRIRDRNFEEAQPVGDVDWCITSGCLMSVEAYRRTAGYDADLFIDMVDADICFSLREAGYRIVRIPFDGLLHEVGHGKKTVLGYSYNEPAWRDYYMARNRILVAKKHGRPVLREKVKNMRDILIVLFFEDRKAQKIKEFVRGWKAAR